MLHGFMSYEHWDFCDGIPVTHYLEPVVNSKRVCFFEGQDEDLFRVQVPTEPASCYHHMHRDQRKKGRGEQQQRKKQNRVCYASIRTPKAVDEDLYKIPPELLCQIPKRKRILGNFLTACLGLSCTA